MPAWLPALSAPPKLRGTVGFQSPYVLQPSIPSDGGCTTPRSRVTLHGRQRNLYRLCIACAFRLRLSSRLTLIRLTLFRNPWACGEGVHAPFIVTYAYIFFSSRSRKSRGFPSALAGMLPYHASYDASSASAAVLMPAHHPRGSARLVSCYALFE